MTLSDQSRESDDEDVEAADESDSGSIEDSDEEEGGDENSDSDSDGDEGGDEGRESLDVINNTRKALCIWRGTCGISVVETYHIRH